ncbi:molybdopterin biosynthesis protein MoeA [Acidomonas methanolica NBRC 104435]|uniref:Molybdopterin molybdenumtransferase n=3 Tax=Acidomonas methanolica TaxID=437 RepID=A0A023D140_ACIMT|nr:molybdopterin molybdochelatase [Acidomonas methanolica]GAJ27842.1 molybdopterin biosynthesis protein MoeA [Acidomonas methanolica NBRC 104435]GEL00226.1 molybdopterin molybdenumtransferase MoeA [Acidomonas methanolica NBRC 104435]
MLFPYGTLPFYKPDMMSRPPQESALGVAEAETLIRRTLRPLGTERVALGAAAGRILRETIAAERDQPPYDRVMMDGIALRHGAPARLPILGTQRAGMPALNLTDPSGCIETMTGAMCPAGADTIVPVERITRVDGVATLEPGYTPVPGQFIHRRGSDCRAGEALLSPGTRLSAPALAVLAGNGVAEVAVSRRPRLAILSTGDELVPVDGPVRDWEIRRSNEEAIAASLALHGFGEAERFWAPDDPDATMAVMTRALAERDVVILSGGVSMGDFDYVPQALEQLGVRRIFHRVAQRPGRPLWFGLGPQGQAVFALPGNPVSAMTCFTRYVLPALTAAEGATESRAVPLALAEDAPRLPDLTRFMPARLTHAASGQTLAHLLPVSTSGDFNHLGSTDGIVEIPPGDGAAPAGSAVTFHGW